MEFRALDLRRILRLVASTAPLGGRWKRLLSTADAGASGEFLSGSAYEVLGVPESSSFAEIKASFRKLAKETHPDMVASGSPDDAAASDRFLHVLAAYEILSDSKKRADYDSYLLAQRQTFQKRCGFASPIYSQSSSLTMARHTNVVEWLKWYRLAVDDIIMERRVATGTSYFDKLENEFYSAIRMAYYGPPIESIELLPDCFEAEERSGYETSEVLQLVSGRDLFGIVNLVDRLPELSYIFHEKITNFDYSMVHGAHEDVEQSIVEGKVAHSRNANISGTEMAQSSVSESDAYKDLELHIFGRVVAVANRSQRCKCIDLPIVDSEDHIHIFLPTDGAKNSASSDSSGSRTLLGIVTGLGTSTEEDSCSVYNRTGVKTHVIMKHRTLLVEYVYATPVVEQIIDKVTGGTIDNKNFFLITSLLDSIYWLFEPRCSLHDIGGWYIETYGRNKKGKTILSRRQWDGMIEHPEKRLHPAIYLIALAYRTLDLEHAKRSQRKIKDFFEPYYFSIRRWWQQMT
ncbi:hypothetical protein ZIOFF_051544 [Zingiber officinale]|uniref:J domain-containing protein n=1 Tax=Zingiber officinale TaxID=94328 RepID=A0A8J5FM83_ZINOF|nr:hypothetical protein ZIOFF_051544 [Zingiber officinale]